MNLISKPSITQALEYLSLATNIQDWNLRRSKIQSTMTRQEFNSDYAYQIDACGLIVQILGKTSKKKVNKSNKKRKYE
jgi:hypothetical protein